MTTKQRSTQTTTRPGLVRRALGAAATSVAIAVVGTAAIPASAQAAGVVEVGTSPAPAATAMQQTSSPAAPTDTLLAQGRRTTERRYLFGADGTLREI